MVKKIDMHVHAHFAGGPERLRGGTWPTPEEVRAGYDRLGIERGVEMSRIVPERMHDPITSRDAERIFREYSENIPRRLAGGSVASIRGWQRIPRRITCRIT